MSASQHAVNISKHLLVQVSLAADTRQQNMLRVFPAAPAAALVSLCSAVPPVAQFVPCAFVPVQCSLVTNQCNCVDSNSSIIRLEIRCLITNKQTLQWMIMNASGKIACFHSSGEVAVSKCHAQSLKEWLHCQDGSKQLCRMQA